MLFIVNEMETRSKYVSTLKLTQAKFAAARGAPPWLYACLSFFPTISLTLSLCLSFFGSSHAEDEEEAAEETKKKGQKFWSAENGKRQKLVGKIVVFVVGGKTRWGSHKKKNSEKRQKEKNTKMVKKMENQKLLATR